MKIFPPGGTTVFINPPNGTVVGTMTKHCTLHPLRPAHCILETWSCLCSTSITTRYYKSFFALLTVDIRLIALIARPVLGHISAEF